MFDFLLSLVVWDAAQSSGLAVTNVRAFMCAILHAAAWAFEFLRGVCHREFAKASVTELGV
jgi:hypothetical protein